MLHIILGILKIIGIILGILLFLVFAIVFSILFVPVRYRLSAEKQPLQMNPSLERLRVSLKINWLFHMISLILYFDPRTGKQIEIRFLGVSIQKIFQTVKSITHRMKNLFKKKTKRNTSRDQSETSTEYFETSLRQEFTEQEESKGSVKLLHSTDGTEREDEFSEPGNEKEHQNKLSELSELPDTIYGSNGFSQTDKTEEIHDDRHHSSVEKKPGKATMIFLKIKDLILSLIQKISQLREKISHGLEGIQQSIQKIKVRYKKEKRKADYWKKVIDKLQVWDVIQDILDYSKYLIRHYGPRKIEGDLTIGAGDPALSAELTGFVYLLLPAKADRFTIHTEFNDVILRMHTLCRGHIRSIHVLVVGWKAYRNRKLMRLIKVLRKKGRESG